ncbi:MAG: DNA polymerase III subunit beta [Planctomycetaceae bacterium]
MKIQCDREKLQVAFHTAAMFAPGRSPKAVLQNVRLDVRKDSVTMVATDMEVGVRVKVEGVEAEVEGSVLLPVASFSAILRESRDEKLRIETTAKGTVVSGERSEVRLPSQDVDEFPDIPVFEEKKYHIITAALFREIILRTEFSTDMESSRYALGGVLVELDSSKIVAVGTDGRRLAKMEGPAEAVGGHKTGDSMTIIRTPSVRLIARAISETDGVVHLAARGNDCLIRTDRATFYSRLVEGRFPRWRDVFPQRHNASQIEMTVGPLHAAIRQAAVVTSQESRGIDFSFGEGMLRLTATTADVGQSRIEMPIAYSGETIAVTLDHRFVTDFLKVLSPEENITLEIENAESAAVFYASDKAYGYVVMPLTRDR